MKTFKVVLFVILVIGIAISPSGYAFSAKYTSPNWGMQQGQVSNFAKGHQPTAAYAPEQVVSFDKQHIPWFESTLKPQNLRREGEKDLLEEAGKLLSGWFVRK